MMGDFVILAGWSGWSVAAFVVFRGDPPPVAPLAVSMLRVGERALCLSPIGAVKAGGEGGLRGRVEREGGDGGWRGRVEREGGEVEGRKGGEGGWRGKA